MRPAVFTFPAVDRDGICASQTTAGAGAVIINGALLDRPATMHEVRRVILPGIARVVSLYSTGNLSGLTFTVTGTNLRGATITEDITGPNNNTVAGSTEFHSVTAVTADGAVTTAVEVGTGSTGSTNWLRTDDFAAIANVSVGVAITATVSVTVQNTFDDAEAAAPTVTYNHPTLAAATASAESNYAFPPGYVRAVMNSSSGSGAFTFTITQAG